MPNSPDTGDGPAPPGRPPPDSPPSGQQPSGGSLTPHDSLFRLVFDGPEHAASELRAVLPPEVAARLDLDRLTLVPGSFVDQELKWRHTDLLYSVPMEGRDAFVYVLLEHQRKDDRLMAFRMLRYIVRIFGRYLDDHPEARTLPPVIPLVVYNGERRWRSPLQVLDLIDLDDDGKKAMEPVLPRLEFLLDDLAAVDEEQLRGREMTVPGLLALVLLKKAPGNRRIVEDLQRWTPEAREVVDRYGREMFQGMMTYIGRVGEAAIEALHGWAVSLGKDAEEALMTTAEMLRAEGAAEAKAEGKAEILMEMLTAKFGTLPVSVSEKVQGASSSQVQEWALRTLTAGKLDDVFR